MAEELFKQAIAICPDHALAKKELEACKSSRFEVGGGFKMMPSSELAAGTADTTHKPMPDPNKLVRRVKPNL